MGDFPIGFGRYQLVERLALGGMAELFIATAPGEHGFTKKVVIKRLLPHLVHDETYNAMFIDEAKLTARLVHPKIAQTFELGKVDDQLFIAMEYVDGIDVLALLREFASRRRRVEPHLAAWIAHETLDALDYAHNLTGEDGKAMGIVHRDISPSNVLLSLRGDIKLVDFGIARANEDPDRAHKSKSGTLKGKYGYMSPEQVIEQQLDARSDVFSVGVVLAELLTGRRLFAAANELDVLLMVRDAKLTRFDKYGMDVESGLSDIVRKALKKSVEERWQSAAQFRDVLNEWLFENRHRVTPKNISDVVIELKDSVKERLNKAAAVPDRLAEDIAVGRSPSENDGAPLIIVEGGDSTPVISLSYESSPTEEAGKPGRAISVSDLAAAAATATAQVSKRAETVAGRPGKAPVTVPQTIPARTATGTTPRHAIEREQSESAVVDVPIADTISAAVEAITMPEPPPGLILDPAPPSAPTPPGLRDSVATNAAGKRHERPQGRAAADDSQMRAFDDLTEEPLRSTDVGVKPPSQEEAMRKRPPTPPALSDITESPDDAGEFHLTSPLRVLFRLMTARATGLLVVAIGGIKKEIYVRDGQPEYVSSNVASELFGNYLVSKGVLSDGELAMALAMMPHYGGKLGDTLVGLGLLKPLEVFRHLTRQVRSKIIDVCTWNKGGFGWYAGRENPREAFPLDFNAFEILGAGAMALSDDHIETWIAKNGSIRLRASRTRRVGPERFEVKGLVGVCDLLDGKRTVGDLVELQPDRDERLKTGRMLCLLEACDLARPA
ncbi:MAG: serine/threonine protein kinase [Deltaproteobacteria bacterium]|nr:serine/threonine protein kinase [Deltaproteobacteria bacterium]